MDNDLWQIYVNENLETMVIYCYYLAAFLAVLGVVSYAKKESGYKFCMITALLLSSFATFFPKEKFIRTSLDTISCQALMKSKIGKTIDELPLVVERTVKAEARKIPPQLEKAVRKEAEALGEKLVDECKLF